ncbi:MAG: M13 family metallopeptidase [Bdellovibrionales bacterium]|nr:M13 family metallopeptidase [Bdellovibrionales bacterium]
MSKNKHFIGVITIFVLGLLLPMIIFAAKKSEAPAKEKKPVASSEIPERREFPVSTEIAACDDFYEYACSEVKKTFKLRPDRSRHVFAFSDSSERLLEAKKAFLKKISVPTQELSPRAKALSDVYRACMNSEAKKSEEKAKIQGLKQKLAKIKDRQSLMRWSADNLLSAEYGFFYFGNDPNLDKPEINDIFILANVQNLPERSYYDRPEVLKAYKSVVKEYLKALGVKNAGKRAQQIVDFEKEFAQTFPLPNEFRELFSSRTSIEKKELLSRFPSFQLEGFLAEIPDQTLIRDLAPQNFAKFNEILLNSDLNLLKDFFLFQSSKAYMDEAYPQVFKKYFDFSHKYLGGPPERPVLEERCTEYVMGDFNKEIDAELLPQFFPHFPRERFIGLAEQVRSAIVEGVEHNTWLSREAKKAAIEKIQTAKLQLVSPQTEEEWDFNPQAEYSPRHYYANRNLLAENLIKKTLAELKKPRNPDRWGMGPLTVNAYYSPADNKFVMPIGILQYPFFDGEMSDEQNLGAVGVVIGHELGHGIDDKGSRFDSKGKLNQWMTKADLAEFNKRGQALVAQFNAIGHNGELTLGENIGDLVGLGFAYKAAFKAKKPTKDEQKAFFTQYARVWCNVILPEQEKLRLKTDPHSSGRARVNEQVKHQGAFAEAFSCAPGSKMTLPPEKRVSIW